MQPHHQFFTSLKHLEKRLKLESHPAPPPPPTEPTNTATQQSDPLGTPIYLNSTSPASSNPHESEAPDEFLSAPSPDFPPTLENQQSEANNEKPVEDRAEKSGLDRDIELLMQLLSLSEVDEGERVGGVGGCDEGFYEKVVGVKGPRSAMEVERLNGWIEYFMKGEKKEPLGLAHLLLGKAGSVHSSGGGGGDEGFVFPSTIDEFLRNDPPVD